MTTKQTMHRGLLALAMVLGGLQTAEAVVGSGDVLKILQKRYPGTKFSGVKVSPIPGLYEVLMGDNIAYVSPEKPQYLVFGHIFDTKTMRDLTVAQLPTEEIAGDVASGRQSRTGSDATTPKANVQWSSLPIVDALTTVKGTGARKMLVFSDAACPYCKKVEQELEQLSDVTIHTFVVPFLGEELPTAIWCSDDRVGTWKRHMLGQAEPARGASKDDCKTPFERNVALAKQLGVRGTPTMIFSDGSRAVGQADVEELASRLDKAGVQATVGDANTRTAVK